MRHSCVAPIRTARQSAEASTLIHDLVQINNAVGAKSAELEDGTIVNLGNATAEFVRDAAKTRGVRNRTAGRLRTGGGGGGGETSTGATDHMPSVFSAPLPVGPRQSSFKTLAPCGAVLRPFTAAEQRQLQVRDVVVRADPRAVPPQLPQQHAHVGVLYLVDPRAGHVPLLRHALPRVPSLPQRPPVPRQS